MKDAPVITAYECRKCGRTDRDRGYNPPAPATLLCYERSCRGEMLPTSLDRYNPEK